MTGGGVDDGGCGGGVDDGGCGGGVVMVVVE